MSVAGQLVTRSPSLAAAGGTDRTSHALAGAVTKPVPRGEPGRGIRGRGCIGGNNIQLFESSGRSTNSKDSDNSCWGPGKAERLKGVNHKWK